MRITKPIGFHSWSYADKKKWYIQHVSVPITEFTNFTRKKKFRPKLDLTPPKKQKKIMSNTEFELLSVKAIFGRSLRGDDAN